MKSGLGVIEQKSGSSQKKKMHFLFGSFNHPWVHVDARLIASSPELNIQQLLLFQGAPGPWTKGRTNSGRSYKIYTKKNGILFSAHLDWLDADDVDWSLCTSKGMPFGMIKNLTANLNNPEPAKQ